MNAGEQGGIGEAVGPAASNVASGISKTLESAIDDVKKAKMQASTSKAPAKKSGKKPINWSFLNAARGTRKPDAAPCALLDLLTLLPDAAPALHTERLESAHGASKPDQATQASPSRKKSTAVPSTVDTSVNLASIMLEVGRGLACTRITPEEYAAIKSSATAQVLPDWMKTKA